MHRISSILYHDVIMDDRVVITGAGLVTSLGLNASETWDAILSGKCGIRPVEDFDVQGFECGTAAQVHGLGASELGIHPRDSRIMDKHSFLLMKCSRDAFTQSGLDTGHVAAEDIGYFAAMGMVDYRIEDLLPSVLNSMDVHGDLNYDIFFSQGYQDIHPLWPLSMLNNISLCQVAIDLGIKGENTVFCPHSDSGIHAVIEAYNTIIDKKAKVILAGGVSEKVSPLSIARASAFGILNNSDATCRPFGQHRKGTVLGEGCGVISLELHSSAEQRKVSPLARITGYGTSFEVSQESSCPTAKAISLSMETAIARAGLNPADIELIMAHGDGTNEGDRNEIEAIHNTFSECINEINVFSSKGAIGHLLGGASAADIVLGINVLKHGIIPAVCNSQPVDSKVLFTLFGDEPVKANPGRILINSCSYEGQCASLIIEAVD